MCFLFFPSDEVYFLTFAPTSKFYLTRQTPAILSKTCHFFGFVFSYITTEAYFVSDNQVVYLAKQHTINDPSSLSFQC